MKNDPAYTFISNLSEEVAAEVASAREQPNIQGHAIFADSVTKVLLFPFAQGHSLREHSTPHKAVIQVLKGAGEITLGDDTRQVEEGAWVMMSPGLRHSILAKSEMLVLLQVFMGGSNAT